MLRRATYLTLAAAVAWLGLVTLPALFAEESLDELQQKAVKAAVKNVAPSVVQIETSGGTDIVVAGPRGGTIRKAAGPTTGLVVSADGYVISSAFNFVNKPSTITIRVPGHKEGYIADVVATDRTRMLTLLKFKTPPVQSLPVPTPAPKSELKVGQTALALGKTLDPNPNDPPSVSQGVVSAVGRIWGKAVQTDAKVAPTNYGGPLVDIQGRVIGVLIPADPRAEGDTAGLEWYDSGIGFAVPLEDLNAVLPRMKAGTAGKPVVLDRGILGITPQGGDEYGTAPKVGTVAPQSAADKGGIKVGDVILEIDGKPVNNYAQVRHALGTKYGGDTATVKVQRGAEEKTFKDLKLGGTINAYGQAILGILPMRDDPDPGLEVRFVYPKGPADTAGVKPGDRVTKVGGEQGPMTAFSGREQLASLLANVPPGTKVRVEVVRADKKKTETLTVTLGEVPDKGAEDKVPETLPEEASLKKALAPRKPVGPGPRPAPPPPPPKEEKKDDEKKVETGEMQRKNAAGTHDYLLYVPRNYDPNVSYALVVWLHPVGKGKKTDDDDLLDAWTSYCRDKNIILAAPKAAAPTGWVAGESDVIAGVVKDVMATYTVDKRRVVAHGMGVGGQFAYYLGFHNRDVIRGVAATGAAMANQPKEKVPNQPLAFYLHVGVKDPLRDSVRDCKNKLIEHKYPVAYREDTDAGHQYLDDKALDELIRWIDSLDRL